MKKIIITCDTEIGELGVFLNKSFEVFIEAKVEKKEVGYRLINSIAEKYDVKIEHFVDIYPYEKYGENRFSKLCNDILRSGHRLGLHTHPSSKYDKNRKYMHQYSLDEQIEIIRFGKDKIREWTGIDVISHRCGGYGINKDTLKALSKNGIYIDSSYFKDHTNCLLKSRYSNKPHFIGNILEIPVTTYKRQDKLPFNRQRDVTTKLDIRYGSSVDDIIEVIKNAPNDSVIILFLHSFNFLNLPFNFRTQKYGRITVNQKLINDYKLLLKNISDLDGCYFSEFDKIDIDKEYNDFFIDIKRKTSILNFIEEKIKNKTIKKLTSTRKI